MSNRGRGHRRDRPEVSGGLALMGGEAWCTTRVLALASALWLSSWNKASLTDSVPTELKLSPTKGNTFSNQTQRLRGPFCAILDSGVGMLAGDVAFAEDRGSVFAVATVGRSGWIATAARESIGLCTCQRMGETRGQW